MSENKWRQHLLFDGNEYKVQLPETPRLGDTVMMRGEARVVTGITWDLTMKRVVVDTA